MDRDHRSRIERSPTWTIVLLLAARRDASGIAALSLRNRRRHRGARRRPPAAAPSDAAGIAACGARAARALRAPRARPDRGRSSAAALRCRGRCRLGGATRRQPSTTVTAILRPATPADSIVPKPGWTLTTITGKYPKALYCSR